jgi:anti-sigma regulatory factor (Ser/Thr protein kinase)
VLDGVSADVGAWQQRETFDDDCSIMTFAFPARRSEESAGTPPDAEVGSSMAAGDEFHLSIGSTLGEIGKVIDLLADELATRRVPAELVHASQTVADELVTNVIRHGYRDDQPHTIDVVVAVYADGLTLQLSDDGIPFDPFSRPAPDLNRPLAERPVGGFGIPLVRRLAAECRYARVDGRNQVTIILKQPAP